MSIIRAGVLSDSHTTASDPLFPKLAARAFADCGIIIHAGDLTDPGILAAFSGKTVYAVHGNTCNAAARIQLPRKLVFRLGRFTIALAHGDGRMHIEDGLWAEFPEADCIIYDEARHELLHEICKDEVMKDILSIIG